MPSLLNFQAQTEHFKDRVILVTGAGTGLGAETAVAAGALGATVVLLGRNIPNLETIYDTIESVGGAQPAIYPIDLEGAAPKDYDDLAQSMEREFGKLHGIVHCAAQLGHPSQIEVYPLEAWAKVMAVNFNGPFMLTQACLPLMRATGNASVLFACDQKKRAYWGAYGVSKAAVRAFVDILADEQESFRDEAGNINVVCNSIDPGPMRTTLRQRAYPGEAPDSNPSPATKVPAMLSLLAREDVNLTGQHICL